MVNASEVSRFYVASTPFNIAMVALYGAVILVGLTGNLMLIAILWRKRTMRTTTSLLLANVAAADVISLLLCPIPYAVSLTNLHPTGLLGDYICKIFTGYTTTCVTVSVTYITLVVLAVERYHAIVKPLSGRFRLTRKNAGRAIGIIWVCSIAFSVVPFLKSSYDEEFTRCLDPWTLERSQMSRTLFIVSTSLPGMSTVLFCYCYVRIVVTLYRETPVRSGQVFGNRVDLLTKRRIAKILVSVTAAFYICYLPFLIFELVVSYVELQDLMDNYGTFYIVYRIVVFIMYVNSCLNPFFYGFQSSNYRENLKQILRCGGKSKNLVRTPPVAIFRMENDNFVPEFCTKM